MTNQGLHVVVYYVLLRKNIIFGLGVVATLRKLVSWSLLRVEVAYFKEISLLQIGICKLVLVELEYHAQVISPTQETQNILLLVRLSNASIRLHLVFLLVTCPRVQIKLVSGGLRTVSSTSWSHCIPIQNI